MRYLTLGEVLDVHRRILETSGGMGGIRDLGMLESAIAQPRMTFGGSDLYPDPVTKAAALCFSLITNHPFVDGNKRVGHATMETFLVLNSLEIEAPVAEQERIILVIAAGALSREGFVSWLREHVVSR